MTIANSQIVFDVLSWFNEDVEDEFIDEFMQTPRDELIMYHHTLGREIRNKYKLWTYEWTPVIIDGFDMSPDHPDAVSMKIIEDVWDLIHNQNEKGKIE